MNLNLLPACMTDVFPARVFFFLRAKNRKQSIEHIDIAMALLRLSRLNRPIMPLDCRTSFGVMCRLSMRQFSGSSPDADVPKALSHLDPKDYFVDEEILAKTMSPAMFVFMDKVRANIDCILQKVVSPDRWRPHLKTTKLPPVWRTLMEKGVTNAKAATVREARHYLQTARDFKSEFKGAAAADVLLAYPLYGPNLKALGELVTY
jgi:hypothetical protein